MAKTDYSGRPLRPPDDISVPAKLVPKSAVVFDLPDGGLAGIFRDNEAYAFDEDGAFDFDRPVEVPEDMRVPPEQQ